MVENKGVAPVPAQTGSGLTHDAEAGDLDDMTTPTSKRTTPSPAFQFYPNDFLGSTKVQQMSATEVGAYVLLLCACWLDGSIPSDTARLARIARMKEAQFARVWSHLLKECFAERGDRFINTRLESERKKQTDYRKKQKDRADKRWESHGNATALQENETRHPPGNAATGNALRSHSLSHSLSQEKTQTPRPPSLIPRRRMDAAWEGPRVYVPHRLHADLMALRGGDPSELLAWYESVSETFVGEIDPDMFAFWRARYREKWPPTAETKPDPRVPAWAR
jgi:uncharacterized protein YdaU (DUF1376 family)